MALKVAFIGGDINQIRLINYMNNLREIEVVLVADQEVDSPAISFAKRENITTTNNVDDIFAFPDLDILINLRGTELLSQKITPHITYLDQKQAEFLTIIFSIVLEKEIGRFNNIFKSEIRQIKKFVDEFIKITKNIDILAINASIEAARAGESGKGFGVVASNIKGLVKDSKDTIKHISDILKKLAETKEEIKSVNEKFTEED